MAQVVAGPLAGGLLSPLAAAWVGTGGVLLNVVYTLVCVRESLPPAARKQVPGTPWRTADQEEAAHATALYAPHIC